MPKEHDVLMLESPAQILQCLPLRGTRSSDNEAVIVGRLALLLSILLCLPGCAGVASLVRPTGAVADVETQLWQEEILRRGQDGDWLVIRGYNSADHVVALAGNAELSHVGVLDLREAAVVEAVAPEVRQVSLHNFLEGADRVILIRPDGAAVVSGRAALGKARSQIGAPYDHLGTIGLPEPEKFYCSELAVWSVGHETDVEGVRHIFHPADMPRYGTVLFDSESRTR